MLRRRRGHRAGQLRSCLAAWLAAFLAVAPFAHPSLPADPAAGPAAIADAPAAQAGDGAGAPTLAIPSRGPLLEATLALAAAKPPGLRSPVGEVRLAPSAVTAFGGAERRILERSSVGTARTPTGPPS